MQMKSRVKRTLSAIKTHYQLSENYKVLGEKWSYQQNRSKAREIGPNIPRYLIYVVYI